MLAWKCFWLRKEFRSVGRMEFRVRWRRSEVTQPRGVLAQEERLGYDSVGATQMWDVSRPETMKNVPTSFRIHTMREVVGSGESVLKNWDPLAIIFPVLANQ